MIRFEVPDTLRWDELASRRFRENAPYFVGTLVAGIEGRVVTLEAVAHVSPTELQARCEALAGSIAAELRDAGEPLLAEYRSSGTALHSDPMPALFASGAVTRTGRGRYAYAGVVLELIQALDALLESHARTVGAEPRLYPVTVDTQTLLRSGYLKTFPQHAYFVAPAAMSADHLRHIASARAPEDLEVAGRLATHAQVLAPTVCYHCFEALQGQIIDGHRCYTAMNHCHRFEVDGDRGLDRLHDFRMREVIALGDPVYTAGVLDGSLEFTRDLLRKWDIAHRVHTATDPFFAGAQSGKLFYQAAFALKRELRLHLGYDDRWLAVASFNNHQQSLTMAFSIGDGGLHSACVGWGHERLALALMAALGVDVSDWPVQVRTDLGLQGRSSRP